MAGVGTTIFATPQSESNAFFRITVGVLSLTATILSSLYLFLRQGDTVQRHKQAYAKYGELRREIEQRIACPPSTESEFCTIAESIRTRWDTIDKESPTLPQRLHNRSIKQIDDNDNKKYGSENQDSKKFGKNQGT